MRIWFDRRRSSGRSSRSRSCRATRTTTLSRTSSCSSTPRDACSRHGAGPVFRSEWARRAYNVMVDGIKSPRRSSCRAPRTNLFPNTRPRQLRDHCPKRPPRPQRPGVRGVIRQRAARRARGRCCRPCRPGRPCSWCVLLRLKQQSIDRHFLIPCHVLRSTRHPPHTCRAGAA